MKIYNVTVDANIYQWIMPQVADESILDFMSFECKPRSKQLLETDWYVYNPTQMKGDFFSLGISGVFAFNEKVYQSDLFTMLEMSGEILPIMVEDEPLFLLNILECVNMLNEQACHWDTYEDGSRGRILSYSFHVNRVSESSLFKIPQTCKTEMLTYTGLKSSEDEFKSVYEKLNFTGLVFQEIFST